MHRRASMIKKMDLVAERPGLLAPAILPVRLSNQNKVSGPESSLDLYPDGKTLTGSVQWAFKVLRPGLMQPLIVSKKDNDKALKEAGKVVAQDAQMLPKAAAAAPAKPAPAPAPAKPSLSGFLGWFLR